MDNKFPILYLYIYRNILRYGNQNRNKFFSLLNICQLIKRTIHTAPQSVFFGILKEFENFKFIKIISTCGYGGGKIKILKNKNAIKNLVRIKENAFNNIENFMGRDYHKFPINLT